MKTAKIAITSLLSLAIVGQANAQQKLDYNGSDTLGPIIKILLDTEQCGNINYLEEGSSAGQTAMVNGLQRTAPMSSNLKQAVCDANSNAKQAVVAVDKLLVVRNNKGAGASCDTEMVADVAGYSSSAPAWAEALQLIYGGDQGAGTAAACDAQVRKDLIGTWSNLWANDCASGSCTKLRFAFRRGDRSGTTKVFKKLTKIDGFCNGDQHEDKDPVRTGCGTGEAHCDDKNELGLVQAIDIPKAFPATKRLGCVKGFFGFAFAPAGATKCIDGTPPFLNFLCQLPKDCQGRFGCVNFAGNGSTFNPFMNGLDYNRAYVDENGGAIDLDKLLVEYETKKDDNGNVVVTDKVAVRYSLNALYMNGNCTAGDGANATLQIGCLVSQSDCSIGFGGRSMLDAPVTETACARQFDAQGTPIGGLAPLVTKSANNTASRFDGKGLDSKDYPLSRNLYFNTLALPVVGGDFDCNQITNADEKALCQCVFNDDLMKKAVSDAGFVPVEEPTILGCNP